MSSPFHERDNVRRYWTRIGLPSL